MMGQWVSLPVLNEREREKDGNKKNMRESETELFKVNRLQAPFNFSI